ncbi:MAG: von Willebrand factor type A domain-containing protein [Chloroflexi bacterium]|nr:von Willebrand factor type A domain-containing protein [Chloroflexota bacterium]
MNAKHLIIVSIVFTLLLAACGGAATPVQISAPQATQAPYVITTQAVEAPAATSGPIYLPPAATQAPAYLAPTATPPFDNTFQNYGVNPFIDTYADHLSTFALDVDTASYTVARSYVNNGNIPPADAIRVEEFVNYFQQDYAAPPDVAFALYADGAPSPFQKDGTQIIRVGVQGYEVSEAERKPASLTFVIDISGSMAQGGRLELVKQSLQMLVDRLRPSDTVAIVVYGSDARVMLNPTSGEDRATILSAIYGLQPEGATNVEAGLRLGYDIANLAYRPDGINRVILCSDGVANVGATGPDQILQSVRGYADAGITLTTVGFGMGNFNDVLMEQLADNGDGNYAYVDDLDEANKLFVEDMTSTLQVIALNAKVQVDFNNEVVARYRLIGYENRAVADQDFRNNAVDAGEIGAGHTVTALYAVQFHNLGAEGRIATVSLRWEDPTTHEVKEINGNFNSWDMAKSFDEASLRYQLDVVVSQYAELLRRSPYAAETTFDDLRIRSQRLAAQLPGDADVAELAQLVERASQLSGW